MTTACYPVLMSKTLTASRDFYTEMLGWKVSYEADFYVSLVSPDGRAQVAFVQADHPSVPEGYRSTPAGSLVTVELEDVDAVHARCLEQGKTIILPLRDEPWGQRHFMVEDPNGVLVDLVKMIPPNEEHAAFYRT